MTHFNYLFYYLINYLCISYMDESMDLLIKQYKWKQEPQFHLGSLKEK